jgi:hypothetical protein
VFGSENKENIEHAAFLAVVTVSMWGGERCPVIDLCYLVDLETPGS